MSDWTDNERNLLNALQSSDSPKEEDVARVRRKVGLAVAAGTVATAVGASALPSAVAKGTTASFWGLSIAKLIVASTVTLAACGGSYWMLSRPLPVPSLSAQSLEQVVDQEQRAEQASAKRESAAQQDSVEPPPDLVLSPTSLSSREAELSREQVAAALQSSAKKLAPSEQLTEETALLSQAHEKMQSLDFSGAIRALGEHQKRFPEGILSTEREASLAVAYCQSGALEKGRAKAKRLYQANPNSPMVHRMQTACGRLDL